MRVTRRFLGILACSTACNVFLLLSPYATGTVQAKSCQQDCNQDVVWCNDDCDSTYVQGSDDWQACRQACGQGWLACSSGASWCSSYCISNPTAWYCGRDAATGIVTCGTGDC